MDSSIQKRFYVVVETEALVSAGFGRVSVEDSMLNTYATWTEHNNTCAQQGSDARLLIADTMSKRAFAYALMYDGNIGDIPPVSEFTQHYLRGAIGLVQDSSATSPSQGWRWSVLLFSKSNKMFLGYFDPENIFFRY